MYFILIVIASVVQIKSLLQSNIRDPLKFHTQQPHCFEKQLKNTFMSDQPSSSNTTTAEQKPEKIYYDTPYGRRPPPKPEAPPAAAKKADAPPAKERVYYDTPYGRKPPSPKEEEGDACCQEKKKSVNHNYCSNLV